MSLHQAFNWTKAAPKTLTYSDVPPSPPPPPQQSEPVQGNANVAPQDSPPRKDQLDFYVDASSFPRHDASDQSSAVIHPAETLSSASGATSSGNTASNDGSDIKLADSLRPIFQRQYLVENPTHAARTLIALISQQSSSSALNGPFRTREMSCESRKHIIAEIRDTESRSFWGALLEEMQGRTLLATWLRDTIDDPARWASTRMPLLRLLDRLPVLKHHIMDDATNNCLGRAVGVIVKKGQEKSRNLASEIKEKWLRIADGSYVEATRSNGLSSAKRLAVEETDDGARKKSKVAAPPASKMTNQDTMQTLSALSHTSAYLSATSSLAGGGGQEARDTKMTVSGSNRSADLTNMAKKTVTRVGSDVKEVCPKCKTVLIAGVTSSTRIKTSAVHGRKIEHTCLKCQEKVKKVPAPPTKSIGTKSKAASAFKDEQDEGEVQKSHNKAPLRRPTTGKDMFSDLIAKPAPSTQSRKAAASSTPSSAGQTQTTKAQESTADGSSGTQPKSSRKKGKKVRWRDDNLVEVKLIESIVDLDAETHASIEEHGLQGLEMDEGKALRASNVDMIDEEVDWFVPVVVDAKDPTPERGTESKESAVQEQREKSVLSAIYMDDAQIPPTPDERSAEADGDDDSAAEPAKIGLPEGWESMEAPAITMPNIAELMRQLSGNASSGDSVEAAAAKAQTQPQTPSLESLGISQDGLQGLLASIGQTSGQQTNPPQWASGQASNPYGYDAGQASAPHQSPYGHSQPSVGGPYGHGQQYGSGPQWRGNHYSNNPYR